MGRNTVLGLIFEFIVTAAICHATGWGFRMVSFDEYELANCWDTKHGGQKLGSMWVYYVLATAKWLLWALSVVFVGLAVLAVIQLTTGVQV